MVEAQAILKGFKTLPEGVLRSALPGRLRGVAAMVLVAALGALAACQSPGGISMGDRVWTPPDSKAPNVYGNYLAGRLASAERDTTEASMFFQKALAQDPESGLILDRAFLLKVADGDVVNAVPLAKRIVARDGDNRLARLVLALDAFKRGAYEEARTHLSQARNGPLNAIVADIINAWTYAAEQNEEQAMAALEKGANSNLSIFYVSARGHIRDYLGEGALAEADFAQAVRLTDGRSLIDVLSYGSLLERLGKKDAARKVYMDYLDLVPGHDVVAAAVDRLDKGLVPSPRVESPDAGVALAIYNPASYLAEERAVDLPIAYLHLALFMDPDFDSASILLADLYEAVGRWQDALDAYRSIPRSSDYYESAQIQSAVNLDRLDHTDEAIRLLKEMAKANPRMETLSILGDMLRFRERHDEAVKVYTQAIDLQAAQNAATGGDEDWGLYYARGVSLEQSGHWAEAEKDLLKAQALSPNQPLVLNYLGYSWIDQGKNLDEALGLIQTAVSIHPDDGFIVDSLGWAYYKLGKYDIAVRYLERAVELQPNDAIINEHLGDAYWMVGRTDEARFQWAHALRMDPDKGAVPGLKTKLDRGLMN